MSSIVPLRHKETPAIQVEALTYLQESLGPQHSKDVIERAALVLSDRLWALEAALYDGDIETVDKLASRLVTVSAQIGLAEFSLVASDLIKCIARQDVTSMMAVSARLLRVGERSLFLAVQFPENVG